MKSTRNRLRISVAGLMLLLAPHAAPADVVTDWNAIMQSTVFVPPTSPFSQTRGAAITQLAVFEAVNAIIGDYEPYLGVVAAPAGASPEAAAAAAAHGVLSVLYPASAGALDVALADSLSAIPDGASKDDGVAVGIAAAEAMVALRSADGSSTAGSFPYTPGSNPGDWRPTPAGFAPAAMPGWGLVDTFGIDDGAQFRAAPPPLLHTGKYARDWEEVRVVGSAGSTSRPIDRANVARVYAVLTFVNLYHPIARELSVLHGKTLSENARIFALLAMAGADGLISSMEGKFYYDLWRPVTAIQMGNLDGNAKTWSEPTWATFIATPPYPSYPSNHASGSGASIAVLEDAFGKRGHSFSVSTPSVPDVVLNYATFEDIGVDIDDARVFGGIHFRFDQVAGRKQGTQVGHHILQRELRPVHGK
ncbi:MAG TPA: vanadium-dependent haloperoxidase, partial [Opitutaceae bacterium]|nr:vanadium-dependent haloperoxidase [Opitutaceae bacterium]